MRLAVLSIDRVRAFPPRMTEFTQRFWQGLSSGRFETTRCEDCGRLTFPPKPFCPHCWSKRISWMPLSGRGKLYSQTVVHAAPAVFQDEVPYRVGIVDLDEGVRALRARAGAGCSGGNRRAELPRRAAIRRAANRLNRF